MHPSARDVARAAWAALLVATYAGYLAVSYYSAKRRDKDTTLAKLILDGAGGRRAQMIAEEMTDGPTRSADA